VLTRTWTTFSVASPLQSNSTCGSLPKTFSRCRKTAAVTFDTRSTHCSFAWLAKLHVGRSLPLPLQQAARAPSKLPLRRRALLRPWAPLWPLGVRDRSLQVVSQQKLARTERTSWRLTCIDTTMMTKRKRVLFNTIFVELTHVESACSLRVCGRDPSISIFHALGKILHNKRQPLRGISYISPPPPFLAGAAAPSSAASFLDDEFLNGGRPLPRVVLPRKFDTDSSTPAPSESGDTDPRAVRRGPPQQEPEDVVQRLCM
jgi:hypothetical protein